jgi:hypothetical protein
MGILSPRMTRRTFAGLSAAVVARAVAGHEPAAWAVPSPAPGAAGTSAAVTVNTQVSVDAFAAHIEPALAVNPRDPRNLLAACRVFQDSLIGLATYVSFDAGRTWHGNGLLPGVAPDFDGNASVAFDGHGRGYVCAIQATTAQPRHGDAYVWRTDDGGRSFGSPVTALAAGAGLADHPSLAISRPSAAANPRLYIAARMFGTGNDGIVLTRSLDGGRTFGQPIMLAAPTATQAATLPAAAIGPDGMLCVIYVLVDTSSGAATLKAAVSADGGESFAKPASLASATSLSPDLGNVTIKSGAWVAASPYEPRFYAVMTAFDDNTTTSSLLLAASADGARTWNPPITLATSDQTVYLQPQAAVDAEGRIAVSVYALSIAAAKIDVLLYLSEPGRTVFGAPRRVTTRSFDPRQAINTGSTRWLGNYQALAVSRDVFHPMWTDTRTGDAELFTAAIRRGA